MAQPQSGYAQIAYGIYSGGAQVVLPFRPRVLFIVASLVGTGTGALKTDDMAGAAGWQISFPPAAAGGMNVVATFNDDGFIPAGFWAGGGTFFYVAFG